MKARACRRRRELSAMVVVTNEVRSEIGALGGHETLRGPNDYETRIA